MPGLALFFVNVFGVQCLVLQVSGVQASGFKRRDSVLGQVLGF